MKYALSFNGASWYVRLHRYEHVRAALDDVIGALLAGDEDIRNPAGLLRHLVAEAERVEAGTGTNPQPLRAVSPSRDTRPAGAQSERPPPRQAPARPA